MDDAFEPGRASTPVPEPDPKLPRAQWVYEVLIAGVRSGRYGRGERIREEAVARALGVSRTPVREALARLVGRGLLELAPGGLVVTTLSRPQVLELYAMREVLEGSAARFAAQHAAPTEVASLRRLAERFGEALGDAARLATLNRELHGAIYEAAHNRYLLRTLDELNDSLALLQSTTMAVRGRPEASLEEHDRIIEAIARRDPEAAEREARAHIQHALRARLELMF